MLDVQTLDMRGLSISFLLSLLVGECLCVECRVEEYVERFTVVGEHSVGVVDLVDVDALEEGLVADAA
ncbi:hypothetical protein [Propionibacterium freudenreichii]|uniref:hypothetical protein n=1 Tax=Propionibacterium freudenreichii TaxID=1744 RepID=UPI0006DC3FDD|nr:hypothetical protein [Propionibacterium freudenreichii]